jgi:hypothetical protein
MKLHVTTPGYYEFKDDSIGYSVKDDGYPGILTFRYSGHGKLKDQPSGPYKVAFYDEQKNLIRSINLRASSPYTPRAFPMLAYGYPDRAYIKDPPHPPEGYPCPYTDLPQPTNFSTSSEVFVSPGGYVCIAYYLYKLNENLLVGDETTLVVYDHAGIEIDRVYTTSEISSPFVSTEGKYLAFLTGGTRNSSVTGRCSLAVDIKDLTKKRTVYHHEFKALHNSYLQEVEQSDLLSVVLDSGSDQEIRMFLDLQAHSIHTLSLDQKHWKEALSNFTTYKSLLEKYPGDIIRF